MGDAFSALMDQHADDTRYLSLVRDLADDQCSCDCGCPEHLRIAAHTVNTILGNPELLWKLMVVSAGFEKRPPPGLDELKQSFWRLEARRGSQSDGYTEKPSSDG